MDTDGYSAAVMKDEQGRPFIVVRECVWPFSSKWKKETADRNLVKGKRRDSTVSMQSSHILLLRKPLQTSSRHLWYDPALLLGMWYILMHAAT